MVSLKEEFGNLKTDFSSLQKCLQEKIYLMEIKIKEIETKIQNYNFEYHSQNEIVCKITSQEFDNKTRDIIEELMWESTLSEAVLHIQEVFKDNNSREKFLRNALELVLEKDEQYRKMLGTLFGHLINQNIITQYNIFNSLCSVLLVIENSNNYNTKMWQNLTEVLLPIITDNRIKFLQLQRKAQTILKKEYYTEFINNLHYAVESNKKQKLLYGTATNSYTQETTNLVQSLDANSVIEKKNHKFNEKKTALNADYVDIGLQNIYRTENFSKLTPSVLENTEKDNIKIDFENFVNNLTSTKNFDEAITYLKKLQSTVGLNIKTLLEGIIDIVIKKETEHRKAIGTLLINILSQEFIDSKQLLTIFCKCIVKLEPLIVNQKTRTSICEAFADILLPLLEDDKIKLNQLVNLTSTILPEETKTIFMWYIEKILRDKGVIMEPKPNGQIHTNMLIKQYQKFREKSKLAVENFKHKKNLNESVDTIEEPILSSIKFDKYEKNNPNIKDFVVKNKLNKKDETEDQTEHEQSSTLKQKNLPKEKMENMDGIGDSKTNSLVLNDQVNKAHGEENEDILTRTEEHQSELEQIPAKQPENLPSNVIKEKIEDIIEHMIETGSIEECVNTVKYTFNDCQMDLVFKAAYEYTKEKSSECRIQCGYLISEAFKQDPQRIGAQIMNIISLELGDFVDTPELWNNMAEIICPLVLNGAIRFVDFRLLPKCFLKSKYCMSLLLAIFKQITYHKGSEWLQENWKKSQLDFSVFLPTNSIYKFITENHLEGCTRERELAHYKNNAPVS